MPTWQVYVDVHREDVEALRAVAAARLSAERFGLITEVFADGSEGGTQLALTVAAQSLGGAVNRASEIWKDLREHAPIEPALPRIDFVVGPIDQDALFHQVLLGRAHRLLGGGEPTYAVVAAQTALEIYLNGILKDLMHAMSPSVVAAVLPRTPTLRDRSSAALFEALTGHRPSASGSVWTAYQAHAKRRHGIVHEGLEVDRDDALESVRSVEALIGWLDAVVA